MQGDFDAGKVKAVRAAIENGTFKVDAEVVADKMLANSQEFLLAHQDLSVWRPWNGPRRRALQGCNLLYHGGPAGTTLQPMTPEAAPKPLNSNS